MRPLLFLVLILLSYSALSQQDSNIVNLIKDVIGGNNDKTTIGYLEIYEPSGYDFFSGYTRNRKVWDENSKSYALKLSKKEMNLLNEQIEKARNYKFPPKLLPNATLIPSDSLGNYIAKYPKNKVYLFAMPMFIRNHTIALFSFIQLNPGTIYPSKTVTAFYRKKSREWKILALLEEL